MPEVTQRQESVAHRWENGLVPQLTVPTLDLADAWRACHAEWGPGQHEDGFGLLPDDDVATTPGFTEYVHRLNATRRGATPPGAEPALAWWITEGSEVVGGISLRLETTARTEEVGHIGYGIRPSFRGRGLASWALRQTLTEAARHEIDPVILVCLWDNAASAKTIERCGGTLNAQFFAYGHAMRRYHVRATGQRADRH